MPLNLDLDDINRAGIVLAIIISIATYSYLEEVRLFFTNSYLFLGNTWHMFAAYLFSILFGLILIIFLIWILFKSLKFSVRKILNKIEKSKAFQKEKDAVENLLEADLAYDEQILTDKIKEIKNFTNKAKVNRKLKIFIPELKKRLAKARELLDEIERDKRVTERESKLIQIKKEIEQRNEENRIKGTYNQSDKDLILYLLKANEKYVFIKEGLSKKQIDALEKKGFEQINEYSIKENRFIRVLVKQKLNHSKTHTFLVWDTIRLIKEIDGVKNIQEYNTVNADITFTFKNKKYALEIETGTLLGKKQQAQEKVTYLNKNYSKRWMFIISNKNLLSKYNKLGFTAQRKQVSENLKILLKN